MPIYEYECLKCGARIEALQKISEEPLETCEKCSGKLHKMISQSAFHLKGGGWYVTDYAKGSGQGTAAPPASNTESSSISSSSSDDAS